MLRNRTCRTCPLRPFQLFGWDASRDIVNRIELGVRWVSDMELVLLAEILELPLEGLLPPKAIAVKTALVRLRG